VQTLIHRLELQNFKAFERFSVTFSGDAFLVGPNNAGKSTLIAALRAAANMVRLAKRNIASDTVTIDRSKKAGHAFRGEQVGLIEENLRHEFHQKDTRLKVTFASDARLEAIWPIDENPAGYFITRSLDVTLRQPSDVRREFPEIALVPVLAPVEHAEELLSDKYVRANLDSRLASRHFRNQLQALRNQRSENHIDRLAEFLAFAQPWVPELELGQLKLAMSGDGSGLDFYYQETRSRIPKEIFWAGDGMQIWLQLLLHVFRQKDADVIVLDEPDVFLHADLQRRLVNLLESVPAQVISATHSADLLLEASEDSVIWVSRDRKRAVRAPGPKLQWEMSKTLGSAFNIPLARALRAQCALFVEGDDSKIFADPRRHGWCHVGRTGGRCRRGSSARFRAMGASRTVQVAPR
jgi:predicted ATP-dependent endonuclease of OLD family